MLPQGTILLLCYLLDFIIFPPSSHSLKPFHHWLLSSLISLNPSRRLLQSGCSKVYITSRKASACEEACAALNALPIKAPGAKAISIPADSSKLSEIERLVAEVSKTTDHVDILLANAGATWGEKFDTHPESAFAKVMDLNVKSVFVTIQK